MTITKLVLQLAARTCGVSNNEVPGYDTGAVAKVTWKLAKDGRLHKAKLDRLHVRYFTHVGLRDQLIEKVRTERRTPAPLPGFGVVRAPWSPSTPAVYPRNPDGTPAWKHTICPSPEPRFEARELAFVLGANQRGVVCTTGRR